MPVNLSNPTLGIGKLPGHLLGSLLGSLTLHDQRVLVGPGIGRDAAAIRMGDEILVLKSDPITFASAGAARYLININANDLACLGAIPRWMLVTALFPVDTREKDVAATFAELNAACEERGITLVGGHTEVTSAVNRPVLVGMLSGIATDESLLIPGGALVGDDLIISHPIAIEGTALLASELTPQLLSSSVSSIVLKQAMELLDLPGISVARAAAAVLNIEGVRALHDPTEGGIAMGVREIAEASGHRAHLHADQVPILPECKIIAAALGLDPLGMLASGSLLIACAPSATPPVFSALRAAGCTPAKIGTVVRREQGHAMTEAGLTVDIPVFDLDEVSRALSERS